MSDTNYNSSSNLWLSGKVNTNLSQPLIGCYRITAVTNITGDGTFYTVPFNTPSFQNGANMNFTTGVYTFPSTGVYSVSAAVEIYNLNPAHTKAILNVTTTQGTYNIDQTNPFNCANSFTYMQLNGTTFVKANALDTVEIQVAVFNGTKVVNLHALGLPRYTNFYVTFLG